MIKEIWRDVKGYEGLYKVSNLGRVSSCERSFNILNRWGFSVNITVKEKILKQGCSGRYPRVALSKEGMPKYYSVHRLVAISFIENEKGLPMVNHKNGNREDNCVENLEWCTASENVIHAFDTGLIDKKNCGKHLIGRMPQTTRPTLDLMTGIFYESVKAAETAYNITPNTLRAYLLGRYKHTPKGIKFKERFLVL